MTAEPRDDADIRGDLGTLRIARTRPEFADLGASAADRLAEDVEALLARLAAADRENAELRGEVERLEAEASENCTGLVAIPSETKDGQR